MNTSKNVTSFTHRSGQRSVRLRPSHHLRPVDVLNERGGVMLHADIGGAGWAISHIELGAAIAGPLELEIAMPLFEELSRWPEWKQIHQKSEAQFLRQRVAAAVRQAKGE